MDGASLADLINEEGVTFSGGVPTIWTMYLAHLDTTGTGVGNLKRLVIGGSAVPAPDVRRRGFSERTPADEAGLHAIWLRTAPYLRRWTDAHLGGCAGGCAPTWVSCVEGKRR